MILMLTCLATGAALAGQPQTPKPYETIRTLQKLQDAIAHGNGNAYAVQDKLIAQTAQQFHGVSPEGWKEPRNFGAAVVFVLSGGPPDAVEQGLAVPGLAETDRHLLEGAIAFANGQKGKAAELLGHIDARALPPALGGHVALAQSMLTGAEDKQQMLRALETARWLMPGTLVEEAALRRAISVSAEIPDPALTDKLAETYMRRFSTSIYATYFAGQFAEILARAEDEKAAERLARLGSFMGELPPAFQLALYLSIAKTAASQGKTALAAASSAIAGKMAAEDSPEKLRAKLYEAATMIVDERFADGVEQLKSVDETKLAPDDAALRNSALAVAEAIRKWPEPVRPSSSPHTKRKADDSPEAKAISELIAKARKELMAAEEAERQAPK
jgi:chemotaxis protein MotC